MILCKMYAIRIFDILVFLKEILPIDLASLDVIENSARICVFSFR